MRRDQLNYMYFVVERIFISNDRVKINLLDYDENTVH